MKKVLLSLILSSFSLLETQAISTKSLGCQFHNSRKCAKPKHFEKELAMGCASAAGNCRYQFCKSNCLSLDEADNEFAIQELCEANCFNPALLARFDEKTRAELYQTYHPTKSVDSQTGLDNAEASLGKELAVLAAKKKKWWGFGRTSKDTKLLNQLEARYLYILKKLENKRKEAIAKGKTESAQKNQEKMELLAVNFSNIAVNSFTKEEMTTGQKAKAKAQISADILQTVGAPPAAIKAAKRMSTKPEVAVKSDKYKRASQRLSQRRASTASLEDASAAMVPPPPAPPLPNLNSGRSNMPPAPTENRDSFASVGAIPTHDTVRIDRGGLLAQIQQGKELRSVRKSSSSEGSAGGAAAEGLEDRVRRRRAALQEDDSSFPERGSGVSMDSRTRNSSQLLQQALAMYRHRHLCLPQRNSNRLVIVAIS